MPLKDIRILEKIKGSEHIRLVGEVLSDGSTAFSVQITKPTELLAVDYKDAMQLYDRINKALAIMLY